MEKNLISVIIVNWNGLANLEACIQSLINSRTQQKIELIIVDNASEDKSISWLHSQKKQLLKHTFISRFLLIQNEENLGFAEGNNIGYAKSKGEFILFLNNDTNVSPGFLDPLVDSLQKDLSIGAVQPTILQLSNRRLVDSIGSYFISTGFLYHIGHNKPLTSRLNKESNVFSLKGACMLFRRSVIEEVGLFDKLFFAYFEETDLCIRTQIAGYDLKCIPSSIVYHKGGDSSNRVPGSFILYHAYKNRVFCYAKNFEIGSLILLLPTHILLIMLISFVYLIQGKFNQSFAIVKGLIWNALHVKLIFLERQRVRKFRTRHDNEFLDAVTRNVRPSYYYHLMTTSLRGYKD